MTTSTSISSTACGPVIPSQPLERPDAALELVRALCKAGTEHYGVDPRDLAEGAPQHAFAACAADRMHSFSERERRRWFELAESSRDEAN
jgi:hypothetical protein